jgi:2-dehydro-3-deoxy-D-arabinonate dehydratase
MMLVRYADSTQEIHIGRMTDGALYRLPVASLADLLAGDLARVAALASSTGRVEDGPVRILAPIDGATELWAAGVTYLRSRDARIEESREGDPYQRVYGAERPELFFKSVAWRVCGPDEAVAIRADSTVDVPEPELAVAVTASGEIAGYAICNDMSSRSIEAENPLYLPQAKTYAGACALGPGIRLASSLPQPAGPFPIELEIIRAGAVIYSGQTSTAQLVREPADLVHWLYAEQDFPAGAILSTGTGIVPDLSLSLRAGDRVGIRIGGIGTLSNPVVRGRAAWAAAAKPQPAVPPNPLWTILS